LHTPSVHSHSFLSQFSFYLQALLNAEKGFAAWTGQS
jgi:hypothetical protein